MYDCKNCGKRVRFATKEEIKKARDFKVNPKHLTKALKVVIEKRPKHYRNEILINKKTKKRKIIRSEGWEIVKVIDVCKKCYKGFENVSDNNVEIECL